MQKIIVAAMLWGAVSIAQAAPITIDFEEYSGHNVFSSTVSQGYRFTNISGSSKVIHEHDTMDMGWNTLGYLDGVATVRMARDDGGSFSLLQLDVPYTSTGSPEAYFEIEGVLAAGGSVSFVVTSLEAHQTVYLTGFTDLLHVNFNLSRVPLSGSGTVATHLDNLVVNVVPIPAAFWLFGSGLAGLAWFRRRAKAELA